MALGATPRLQSDALLLEPGSFDVNSLLVPERCFGLLVLDGLIAAQLEVGRARAAWLLGADDLIRPWEMDELTLTRRARWRALTRTKVLPVAGDLRERAIRNPEVVEQLFARSARTSHWLLARSLILSAPSLEERLLLLFAHSGERWGKVTPRGVRLDLPLTHELLASLCGARRPTVTLAPQSLAKHRFVMRVSRDRWLLPRDPDPDGNCRSWTRYADVLGLDGQQKVTFAPNGRAEPTSVESRTDATGSRSATRSRPADQAAGRWT
jgi:CRP/FNR family transcriptional regulator, cyclic AMP receptor protein